MRKTSEITCGMARIVRSPSRSPETIMHPTLNAVGKRPRMDGSNRYVLVYDVELDKLVTRFLLDDPEKDRLDWANKAKFNSFGKALTAFAGLVVSCEKQAKSRKAVPA